MERDSNGVWRCNWGLRPTPRGVANNKKGKQMANKDTTAEILMDIQLQQLRSSLDLTIAEIIEGQSDDYAKGFTDGFTLSLEVAYKATKTILNGRR